MKCFFFVYREMYNLSYYNPTPPFPAPTVQTRKSLSSEQTEFCWMYKTSSSLTCPAGYELRMTGGYAEWTFFFLDS
jgi:hypothetical protein